MADNPQAAVEQQAAARHLLQHPLVCAEHDEAMFRTIRRHEHDLDRWFTQRLGYRLQLNADTARLHKTGFVPERRPLRTANGRAFHQREYVMLALVMGCVVAGPAVISLRHLVDAVRSAATEAGVTLANDAAERRALVTALGWMIDNGMASELHEHVAAYADNADTDAVLRIRPERVNLVPGASVLGASTAEEVLARADRRAVTRQWLRCRLVEDPVLYRTDIDDAEWGELRRRLGEERHLIDEMFGLQLEARAEGIAAIDADGGLADRPFPATGTVGHCALLLIAELASAGGTDDWWPWDAVVAAVSRLAQRYERRWANDMVQAPAKLATSVGGLLGDVRLAERRPDDGALRLLPAAHRFTVEETAGPMQASLL